MREIKFRAWDDKSGKYIGYCSDVTLETKGKREHYIDHYNWIILEQYTGLKANGKEIYEGDIVQEDHQTAIVMWYKDDACFGIRSIGKYKFDYAFKDTAPKNKEIVGNIHENPELLEVSK